MTQDDFDTKSKAFLEWLVHNGVEISSKVILHDCRDQDQGRGMVAAEDVAVDEVLFSIPRNSVMAVDNDEEFIKLLQRDGDDKNLGPWLGLIAYMMADSNSEKWKPYFDILPSSFNTPMFWSIEETKDLFKGSALVDKIGREEAEKDYHDRVKPVLEKLNISSNVNTVENFHRMGSLIMSYSFDIKAKERSSDEDEEEDDEFPVKAMVPLADMLNAHSRFCNAHMSHSDDNTMLEMRSIKPIPKGRQIYNTYGELPNSDLLRRYGYVEIGGTEYDVVEVSTRTICQAIVDLGFCKDKTVFTLLEQLEEEENPFYDDAYDVPITGEPDQATLVIVMYLYLMSGPLASQTLSDSQRQKLFRTLEKHADEPELLPECRRIWQMVMETRLKNYDEDIVIEARNKRQGIESKPQETQKSILTEKKEMAGQILIDEAYILLMSQSWVSDGCETVELDKIIKKIGPSDNKRLKQDDANSTKRRKT